MPELSAKVLSRAAHLVGEPGDAPLLVGEFLLNEVSDMWCFVHKKGVNPFSFCLYNPKALVTCSTYKRETVHAICVNLSRLIPVELKFYQNLGYGIRA